MATVEIIDPEVVQDEPQDETPDTAPVSTENVLAEITITLIRIDEDSQHVKVTGPLKNKIIALGMLQEAISAVANQQE